MMKLEDNSQSTVELHPNEHIVKTFEKAAYRPKTTPGKFNLFLQYEPIIMGTLHITDRRLIFNPNKSKPSSKNDSFEIAFNDLTKVEKIKINFASMIYIETAQRGYVVQATRGSGLGMVAGNAQEVINAINDARGA